MSDQDLISLYSGRILELAANIPLLGRLEAPQGRARRRSPVCGSVISAEVNLQDGRITDYAQEVRACALGQASAAILGQAILGRSRSELAAAREQLAAMLAEGAEPPAGAFADYALLQAARDYRNRHASILLPLDAALGAIEAAEAATEG